VKNQQGYRIGSGRSLSSACEFDYSGNQACKASVAGIQNVRQYKSGTIMTDPGLRDATYVEPLDEYALQDNQKREPIIVA
jgi:carbamoyl-phosphate synthase large subunit